MLIMQFQCNKCYSVFEQQKLNEFDHDFKCLLCGADDVSEMDGSSFLKERDCFKCEYGCKGGCSHH
ncbi:MAG: hypothetical protein WC269_00405 [Candidatus Gracilibacteria bacterium]